MRRALLLTAALALPLLAGCGGDGDAAAQPSSGGLGGRITVFAAASLTGSFTALGRQFEAAHPGTSVTFSFGASSTLAAQIADGAPADVFASASPKNMDQVVQAGQARDPRTFARNVAQVAVSTRSAVPVDALADLARPGLKVALCQAAVPCGALAQQVLKEAGVSVRPVTEGLDVKAVLAAVSTGEVDAGIVYATDVRAAGPTVRGVDVASAASTAYPIAVVEGTENAPLARAFADAVLSPGGQQVLAEAGFRAP